MKNYVRVACIMLCALGLIHASFAQQKQEALSLGTTQKFLQKIRQKAGVNARTNNVTSTLQVQVSAEKQLSLQVNVQQSKGDNSLILIGAVKDQPNSSFYIRIKGEDLLGNIILKQENKGYRYFADNNGNAFVAAADIDSLLCISYPKGPQKAQPQAQGSEAPVVSAAAFDLQSQPGAYACMMLDFDGQYVVNTPWESGRAINAAPAGMSDAQIQEFWELVSEDFRPFNVNITTSEAVFNSYPRNRRMRCIVTPTNFTNGAGGVAFVGSFSWDDDSPCWVFMPSPKAGGEAASHELGHTVGLSHDGRTNPAEGYFAGHGNWAPIMGVGYYKPITQWSRGEYANANNKEDDLSIISGYLNYRGDDHGNNFASSTNININSNNQINGQNGVIERAGDLDFFKFNCGTGNVTLDINTVGRYGDLDVLVRLYEARTGNQIGVFNGGGLNTRLEAYLEAGVYYLAVDGTGAGNPATDGYSDYASLGSFSISGTIPAGNDNSGVVTVYQDCSYGGYGINLAEGNYTVNDLQAMGIRNDDVSSVRVQNGYQVTFYADNDFLGRTLLKTEDDDCLVNENFNDLVSSIRVARISSSVAQIEAEKYSAMQGVQVENCAEGGQNVGYIDQGDWMTYNNISFPTSGRYLVEYRVASANGGGRLSLDINAGADILGEKDIPSTGGWQKWETISQTINVNAGTYNLGVFAQSGGWNLNWIKITPQSGAAIASLEARTGKAGSATSAFRSAALSTQVTMYPNPVASQLHLTPTAEWKDSRMSIINALGVKLWEGNFQETLDVTQLKTGLYSVILNRQGKQLIRKMIKQ